MKTMTLFYAIAFSVLVAGIVKCSAQGERVRVIDGDTFKLGDTPIRLWGIDAPELDTSCGQVAKITLELLLERGGAVDCQRRQVALSHGRVVAQCHIGEIDIGAAMVRAGMAFDWPHFSNGFYGAAQTRAMINHTGMWQADGCTGEGT